MACNKFSTFILMLLAVRMCLASEKLQCEVEGKKCVLRAMDMVISVAIAEYCPTMEGASKCFAALQGCEYDDLREEIKSFTKQLVENKCDTSDLMWHNEALAEMANDDDLKMKDNECETKRRDCVGTSVDAETAVDKASFCKKMQEAHECVARIVGTGNCEKGDAEERNSIMERAKNKKCDISKYFGMGSSEVSGATTKPPLAILLLSAILFLFAL